MAICSLMPHFIKFPAEEEMSLLKREFYGIARFPNIIGAIDGTHIRIKGPSVNEADYVNRKGFHSINVQAVCDAKYLILNLVAKWPGSVHDSQVFRESELCQMLEQGQINGTLLGDSGYPCRPFLMTPYLRLASAAQERFNISLTKTRVVIEQMFAVLKRRYPCLSYGLRVNPEQACRIVGACAVLHNFGIKRGDIFCRGTDISLDPPDIPVDGGDQGSTCRDLVANTYFS